MQTKISTLADIRIVLVEPSHPGNIGAVARAMKVMGLEQLCLVNPKCFPHEEATARATQAVDILTKASVVKTFAEAIQDCNLVLGTSARERTLAWPTLDARTAAQLAIQEAQTHSVAIVFGREKSGLLTEELQRCHYQVVIPCDPTYTSLNLAAAVQVICYEIYMASLGTPLSLAGEGARRAGEGESEEEIATVDEIEKFYEHLEQVLYAINYIRPDIPQQAISRLRRLFNRTRLQKLEINILRGILTAMQQNHEK
jgi:tRNA (cytidine32/uridine32-2'-O)-methyltransferase